jgi:hypothetical protein
VSLKWRVILSVVLFASNLAMAIDDGEPLHWFLAGLFLAFSISDGKDLVEYEMEKQ